ncbi:MAG TPA: FAD-dependent oxidoreductase [Thermoanaerobaculia bacterium]|jgi:NADH dehydrogenase FAD-containing subunit
MNERIVILGGGYGGAMAAARLARRGVHVTLIDAGDGLVERIRQHQMLAGDDIPPVMFPRLFRRLPVEVRRARVIALDRAHQRVLTSDGEVPYDKLVYALGSRIAPPAPALSLADPSTGERIARARSVSIVGAGLTGIETAAELAERRPDLAITLIDAGTIGRDLSAGARDTLRRWLVEHRVRLVENRRVESVDDEVVLWCASFAVSPIARDAGLRVNARGQILVDDQLRSSDPNVYAVGDAAEWRGRRMSCAIALPMGAYVGDLLSGATSEPFQFGFVIRCISLGRVAGLVQFVHADDTPKEKFLSGRPAAWIKELICRYTVMSIRMEARGLHGLRQAA